MTAGDFLLIVLALVVLALGVAMTIILLRLAQRITELGELVRGSTTQTVNLLGGINETVSGVNVELARVDAIVAGVQNITATADSLVSVLHATVSSPLIKVAAFTAGAARGARKLKAN